MLMARVGTAAPGVAHLAAGAPVRAVTPVGSCASGELCQVSGICPRAVRQAPSGVSMTRRASGASRRSTEVVGSLRQAPTKPGTTPSVGSAGTEPGLTNGKTSDL